MAVLEIGRKLLVGKELYSCSQSAFSSRPCDYLIKFAGCMCYLVFNTGVGVGETSGWIWRSHRTTACTVRTPHVQVQRRVSRQTLARSPLQRARPVVRHRCCLLLHSCTAVRAVPARELCRPRTTHMSKATCMMAAAQPGTDSGAPLRDRLFVKAQCGQVCPFLRSLLHSRRTRHFDAISATKFYL